MNGCKLCESESASRKKARDFASTYITQIIQCPTSRNETDILLTFVNVQRKTKLLS